MKHLVDAFAKAAILVLAFGAAPAAAQVTLKEFPVANFLIEGMSGDGRVVVGRFTMTTPAGSNQDGIRWTAEGGVENLGPGVADLKVSRDGKTIIGNIPNSAKNYEAAIWQGGKNWRLLGGIPGGFPDTESHVMSYAYGVSADGSVIVGGAQLGIPTHAFRWDAVNGMVDLGAFCGKSSQARAVSGDGNTVLGWNDKCFPDDYPIGNRQGVIFWKGMERLLHPFGWAGEPFAANATGSLIVGQWHPSNNDIDLGFYHATTYRYTAWDGRFENLGAVVVGDIVLANTQYTSKPAATNDDGEVIGGTTGGRETVGAMLWTRATGMVRVREYLLSLGITEAQPWILTETIFVSTDGSFIAGIGVKPQPGTPGVRGSWIVTLR